MLPYPDHVFHWGMLLPSEPILTRLFDSHVYACIKGRGQHKMIRDMSRDIYMAGNKALYYLSADVSKMYASIPLSIPKKHLRRKIKDPLLLQHFDTIIDSSIGTPMGCSDCGEPTGIPIGLKISTILANISLAYFDHDCRTCFRISEDPALLDALSAQYISEKFLSAKSDADLEELSRGVAHLKAKFLRYVNDGIHYYYRFMDNIYILHEDKTFLHLLLDWIALYMSSELHLTINPKWQVGSLIDGVSVVGYRIFSDGHIRVKKDLKDKAIRKILKGRRLGLTDEQIRKAVSSNIGHLTHANSINLLKTYRMETKKRLGKIISNRKSRCPFKDMEYSQKRLMAKVLYNPDTSGNEEDYLMELRDYEIVDSIKDFNDNGTPKQCMVIRYQWLGANMTYKDRGHEITLERGQEYYSFSESKILREQAETEFDKEDLPAQTVIKIDTSKRNKTFYKFT